ncbi:MAG: hypothetical protein SF339_14630 [Blastocatellia bacterium]|nr:hypothetical protein [Blastocatellia bacterium]
MIPSWLHEFATGRNAALALVVWLAFGGLLFGLTTYPTLRAANQNQPLLEERFGYAADEVSQQLQAFGEWRGSYRNFQILDYIHAALMMSALTSLLVFALTRLFSPTHPLCLLALLPALGAGAEFLENSLLLLLLGTYPAISPALAGVASLVTKLKFSITFIVMPLTALTLVALVVKAVARRLTRRP